MKTVLIVPALNKALVIGELIRRVPGDVVDEVIVSTMLPPTRRPSSRGRQEPAS